MGSGMSSTVVVGGWKEGEEKGQLESSFPIVKGSNTHLSFTLTVRAKVCSGGQKHSLLLMIILCEWVENSQKSRSNIGSANKPRDFHMLS